MGFTAVKIDIDDRDDPNRFTLLWLEEPVPPENVDAMRDIRESTSTPICCGENLYLRHGFRELLEKRAADIIMPDIQKCGGLLEARRIADMAHTYYVPVAPHCVVSPIGTMASAHVCAAVTDSPFDRRPQRLAGAHTSSRHPKRTQRAAARSGAGDLSADSSSVEAIAPVPASGGQATPCWRTRRSKKPPGVPGICGI